MSSRRRFSQIGLGIIISSTCAKVPSFSDVYVFLISCKASPFLREVAKLVKVADKRWLGISFSKANLHSLFSAIGDNWQLNGELVDSPSFCYQIRSDVLNGWLLPGTTGSQERIGAGAKINESIQLEYSSEFAVTVRPVPKRH
ncbi:hypothetical protein F5888DRAFT_1697344 [Russula emetica]|nr:hypothetical protein F5888DRAFT_1697344 [Russula emetica]